MKNLRFIDWKGGSLNSWANNFPPKELCCLKLVDGFQKQLWEGCKFLPSLKMMELRSLRKLITTPDFNGLPNLERLILSACECLEEIHPSIECLERLVLLSIEGCENLKIFPPITRLKKLETLSFAYSYKIFDHSRIQQQKIGKYSLLDNKINHHKGLHVFYMLQELDLRKLDLSMCDLGDEDIGSNVWELPNLQELHLESNKFTRLSFSHFRLPRLKLLNMSSCFDLIELSDLPSSIAVVIADGCLSLESIGDISNCKWLWKLVSVRGGNNLGPLVGDILRSMLQGNAIEDYYISISLKHQFSKGFVGRFFDGKSFTSRDARLQYISRHTYTLQLPHDWYNQFYGFLIRIVTGNKVPNTNIIFKHEVEEENSRFEIWQESNEALEPEYDGDVTTYVGYVSFSSLRKTTSLNSSYNRISFSIKNTYLGFVSVELVPRKRKDDPLQITKVATTDLSEYRVGDVSYEKAFTIQHNSKSFIKILWRP